MIETGLFSGKGDNEGLGSRFLGVDNNPEAIRVTSERLIERTKKVWRVEDMTDVIPPPMTSTNAPCARHPYNLPTPSATISHGMCPRNHGDCWGREHIVTPAGNSGILSSPLSRRRVVAQHKRHS